MYNKIYQHNMCYIVFILQHISAEKSSNTESVR